jgi:phage tail-like protein
MRGTITGLASPYPLGVGLPSIYQDEDPFTMRMTQAFDDVLAPIISTLDCLPAYFDAALAPEDFVDWLGDWVGTDLEETWNLVLRRQVVAGAAELHARRGTAAGLAAQVRLVTGGEVEVLESGGTGWSVDAGAPMPGSARPALLVRVRVQDPGSVDPARLDRLVTAEKPAHVPHTLEILPLKDGGSGGRGSGGSGSGGSGSGGSGSVLVH